MVQVEVAWTSIAQEVQRIYAGLRLPIQRAMNIYSQVFEICHATGWAEQHRLGKDLYYKLKTFITKCVNSLYQQLNSIKQDVEFLEIYIEECAAYKRASRNVDIVFSYLNNHWIKGEIDEGNKEICEVYELSISIWKPEMFDKILTKIIYCSANALNAMENGSAEDKVRIGKLITAVCEIFFEYGFKFILQLMHQPKGEASSFGYENYSQCRKVFMRRLLDETNKRLRGEAPPETVLQMPDLNQ